MAAMNMAQMLQDGGVFQSMASELGIDEQTARTGASALLPALVAGMGRQATASSVAGGGLGGLADVLGGVLGGGGGLGGTMGGAGSGGLDGIGRVLLDSILHKNPTPTQPGNDILGEIFGSKDVSRGVAEEAAGSTGIDASLLKKMLPILAMAVFGMMMNRGTAPQPGANTSGGGGPGAGIGGGGLGGALGGILSQVVAGMTRR